MSARARCYKNNVCLRRFLHSISLVSDADSDDSADVDGEKISNRNTIEDYTEAIDEAGFVRVYNFFHLLIRMLCLCLALMNLLLSVSAPFF